MKQKLCLLCIVVLVLIGLVPVAGVQAKTAVTWYMGSWWYEAVPEITAGFQAANPDLELDAQLFPFSGYYDKVTLALMSKSAPDVVAVQPSAILMLIDKGLLCPLDNFLSDSTIDQADYFPAAWEFGTHGGHQYAVPYRIATSGLYYNVKMFEQAGLDPDRPPQTHDELLEYAKKLTIPGKQYGFGIAASTKTPAQTVESLIVPLWAYGGSVLTEDWTKAAIDSPESIKGVEWYVDLYKEYRVTPDSTLSNDTLDNLTLFGAGVVAMTTGGDSGPQYIEKNAGPSFEYRFAPMPDQVTFLEGWALAIPTNARNPEAGFRFIEWFSDPNILPDIAVRVPATYSAIGHQKWDTPVYRGLLESAAFARQKPAIPEWPEIEQMVSEQVQAPMLGRTTVAEAMERLAERINDLLQR